MKNTMRRLLSLAVAAVMLFAVVSATVVSALPEKAKQETGLELAAKMLPEEERVAAIVVLDDDPVIKLGVEANSEKALAYEKSLRAKQSKYQKKFGEGVKVTHQYTELFSGFGVEATAAQLLQIEKLAGVKSVFLAPRYQLQATSPAEDVTLNAVYASQITGATTLASNGYTGDGIVVAVIDTGINLQHEAFQPNEFIQNPAFTKEYVESIETLYGGKYVNEKIPFSFDYFDMDDDCSDEVGHGSHVGGIIGGYCKESGFCGAAPGVQIVGMKVFGKTGTTDDRFVLLALEDCYRLKVDVVNLSLGEEAGFGWEPMDEAGEFENDIYAELDEAGVSVFSSTGNSTSTVTNNTSWWNTAPAFNGMTAAEVTGMEAFPAKYTDYGIHGTPGAYASVVSVASANNVVSTSNGIQFVEGGEFYAYTDPSYSGELDFKAAFGGKETEFVYLDAYGAAEDYEGIDVNGKIVAINRGVVNFQDKTINATNAGAAGLIIVNNATTTQTVSMNIPEQTIPVIWTMIEARPILLELSGKTISPAFGMAGTNNTSPFLLSDFSSWGTTPDLQCKPQLIGIGGSVYSCYKGASDSYSQMSGTSMSTPNVVGTFATVLHYVRANQLASTKKEQAELAEQMLISTANILTDENGNIYTPRKQGAGLANAVNAVTSGTIVRNPNVSLGDDPDFTGIFDIELKLYNMTGSNHSYLVAFDPIVDNFTTVAGLGCYNLGTSISPSTLFGGDYAGINTIQTVHADGNTEEGTITVAAGETVTVRMNLQLHPDVVSYIRSEGGFSNGFFFDGYLSFFDSDEYAAYLGGSGVLAPKCHGTFISYIGDWTAAPAVESITTQDVFMLLSDPNSNASQYLALALSDPETAPMLFDYILEGATLDYEVIQGTTDIWLLTADGIQFFPYVNTYEELYDLDEFGMLAQTDMLRVSAANAEAASHVFEGFKIDVSLLRNAKELVLSVVDEDTGEVYYTQKKEYVKKNIYDSDFNAYANEDSDLIWAGGYHDETGRLQSIPNGTKLLIKVDVLLEYPTAELRNELTLEALVDSVAPEVLYEFDAESKTVKLTVSDNDTLAYVSAYDSRAADFPELAYIHDLFENTSEKEYVIDVSDSLAEGIDTLYVDVYDYASNCQSVAISLDESNSNIPVEIIFDLPESVDCMTFADEVFKYEEFEFALFPDDDHCFGKDYKVTATQGEKELELTRHSFAEDYDIYTLVLSGSDDPITISVEGVMEHDFQPVEILAPDCTFKGLYEYRCTNCGQFDHFGAGTANGHTKDEGQVLVSPTCTECGWIVYHCTECGDVFLVEPIACGEHKPGEAVVTKEADYGVEGEKTVYCTECGKVLETEPIDPLKYADGDVNGDGNVDSYDYRLL